MVRGPGHGDAGCRGAKGLRQAGGAAPGGGLPTLTLSVLRGLAGWVLPSRVARYCTSL
jgi:hypothetical protein